ncbi:MAG: aldo/keto reductase [Bacteroidales bacterium]|nr:aldo/keto reductase [Bacteroidales bacterium]
MEYIGKKCNKSVARTALRYLLQRDLIIIPKSAHIERMEQNLNIMDFELTDEDMDRTLQLDSEHSLVTGSHQDPEIARWFIALVK